MSRFTLLIAVRRRLEYLRTIRGQFLLATFLVVLPLLLLMLFSIAEKYAKARGDAEQLASAKARELAARVDGYLNQLDAYLLTAERLLAQDYPNHGPMHERLARLQKASPAFLNQIFIADRNGYREANSLSPTPPHTYFGDRRYFQAIMSGAPLAIDAPLFGRSALKMVIVMARPLQGADGQIKALIGISSRLETFQEFLDLSDLPPGTQLTVVNDQNIVVAHSDNPDKKIGFPHLQYAVIGSEPIQQPAGVIHTRSSEGKEFIEVFVKTEKAPWRVVVDLSEEVVMGPARYELIRGLLVLGLVLLLVVVFFFAMLHYIVRPIEILAQNAGQIADGGEVQMSETRTASTEVNMLTRAFQRMTLTLQKRNTLLQENLNSMESFNHSVSHDLRAPLRHIEGYTRLIEEEAGTTLDGTMRQRLGRIQLSCARMGRLIDNLLTLSFAGYHVLQLTDANLSRLATGILGDIALHEPEREVEWVIAPDVIARADPGLASIVMRNLLGNAWKYTSKRKMARIEFGCCERNGQRVYFVKDNGVGFDLQYADKLFKPFQRLPAASEFEGSGIGLATVRRIIDRHGGMVWVENNAAEGATVYFTFDPVSNAESK